MCNTAPLLRINFQAIKWHEQSDRRRQPDIVKELKKVKRGNSPKVTRGRRMGGVEIPDSVSSVIQVRHGFPGPISFRPTLPMNEILQVLALVV